MNSLKVVAGGLVVLAIAGTAVACSSQPSGPVDVLQYGYYSPTHVWIAYPQPVIAHVSYNVYHSDSRMYSTPAYEKTYVKTHTVTRSTTTVNKSTGTTSLNKNTGSTSKTTTSTTNTTTTKRR